jgi:hypothetical protein
MVFGKPLLGGAALLAFLRRAGVPQAALQPGVRGPVSPALGGVAIHADRNRLPRAWIASSQALLAMTVTALQINLPPPYSR